MASFFKKIFGKVEQAGEQAATQAQSQAQNTSATASSASNTAQSQIGGARDTASSSLGQARDRASTAASSAQNQATSAASTAQGQAAAATSGAALFSNVEALFSGGMPNVSEIEAVINNLPQGELSNILTNALHQVPADSRNQIGQLVNQQAPAGAAAPSSGVASGNPADLGSALAGILKGGGVSALAGLFTGGAGATGGGGGLQGEVMGAAGGNTGAELGAVMKNPLGQQLLGAILPALMKASGRQQ